MGSKLAGVVIGCLGLLCAGGSRPNPIGDRYRAGRVWGVDSMPTGVAEWTRTTYRPYPYNPGDGRDHAAPQGRKVVRGTQLLAAPGSRPDTSRNASAQRLVESAISETRSPMSRKYSPTVTAV